MLAYYCHQCPNHRTYFYKYLENGNKIECLVCHSIVVLNRNKYIPRNLKNI